MIRVSTEKQEQQGESLRTQRKQIEAAVAGLGGQVAVWFGGQEHATPGWERAERDRLLASAERRSCPFDAVMVQHEDRWSRDDAQSGADLDRLMHAGVDFYVLGARKDLYDPTVRLYLGMSAVIGKYHARNQAKKSIENRIEKARRGIPTAGKLPFGRTFDYDKEQWGIDAAKQRLVQDAAARYLAGESMPQIARDCGMDHSNLCKLLRERAGEQWAIAFDSDVLNIHETITITIPRLLDDDIIQAIHQRLAANRTYLHKPPKSVHDHLLSGYIFCAQCGYGMFGQAISAGHRYYRHAHAERARACPHKPKPWVPADAIEQAVVGDLFDLLGNTAAIDRAIKSAIPDCTDLLVKKLRLESDLAKVERGRAGVLELVAREALTLDQAETKLNKLKEREAGLRQEMDEIRAALADVPDSGALRLYVQEIQGAFGKAIMVVDDDGNTYAGGNDVQSYLMMTRQDRHDLLDSVFSVPQPGGKPSGVYITPLGGAYHGPKRFSYQIRGRLGRLPEKRLDGIPEGTTSCVMPSPSY
jgi:DNA invertase Pin-like site-specific DNA recombinase